MIYGYARKDKKELQKIAEHHSDCDIIFNDKSDDPLQPRLNKLLKVIKENDTLVINNLSSLSPSINIAFERLSELHNNNIRVYIIGTGLIANNLIGEALFGMIESIAVGFEDIEQHSKVAN